MNKLLVTGRIGKDAQIIGQKDTKLLKFSVAETVGYGENAKTQWYDVNTFVSSNMLERAQKFVSILAKGNKVVVTGKLGTREYEGKTYLQIETNMNDIEVVSFKEKKPEVSDEAVPVENDGDAAVNADDIPF